MKKRNANTESYHERKKPQARLRKGVKDAPYFEENAAVEERNVKNRPSQPSDQKTRRVFRVDSFERNIAIEKKRAANHYKDGNRERHEGVYREIYSQERTIRRVTPP